MDSIRARVDGVYNDFYAEKRQSAIEFAKQDRWNKEVSSSICTINTNIDLTNSTLTALKPIYDMKKDENHDDVKSALISFFLNQWHDKFGQTYFPTLEAKKKFEENGI